MSPLTLLGYLLLVAAALLAGVSCMAYYDYRKLETREDKVRYWRHFMFFIAGTVVLLAVALGFITQSLWVALASIVAAATGAFFMIRQMKQNGEWRNKRG